MLILFILLLLWLFPKADLDVFYDQVYTNNIKTMKEAARNYYTVDRLPANVGDSSSMTLKEMVDNKMIIRFTDKEGNVCDESTSKVEVSKISDNEYTLKVQLNCGEQKDYILENKEFYELDFENPINMLDILTCYTENSEKFNLNLWISLDKNVFIFSTDKDFYNTLDRITSINEVENMKEGGVCHETGQSNCCKKQ